MPLRGRNLSNIFKSFIILSDLSKFERFGFGFPLLAADRWFPSAAELNLLAGGDNKKKYFN